MELKIMNKLVKLICIIFSILFCATILPDIANAEEETPSTDPFANAGMSAYVKLDSINQTIFDNATDHFFESAQQPNSSYMVGVKTYYAQDQYLDSKLTLNFYLSTTGWLVVYLTADQEPSKIVNWTNGASLENNLLKLAIGDAADTIGATHNNSEVKYYDFAHPDATRMTLVRENIVPGDALRDDFTISVPGAIHHASYAMAVFEGGLNSWSQAATLLIDGNFAASIKQNNFNYGAYDPLIFTDNAVHTIALQSRDTGCSISAATIILYSVN